MNDTSNISAIVGSYLEQSDAVRARFERLKSREIMLEVSHLCKNFNSGGKTTVALKDVNFKVHRVAENQHW